MCQRIQQTPDFTAKLNIIYLANDVLHHSSKVRPPSVTKGEVFCEAMLPYLSCILYNTYHNQTPENQNKVSKLLAIWKTKQIYEESKINELESDMKGESLKPPQIQVPQPSPVNATAGALGGAGLSWGQTNTSITQAQRPQNPAGGYHAVPPPVALQPMGGNQFQGPPVQQQQQQGNRLMNNLDSFLSSTRNRGADGPATTTGNTRQGSDRNTTRDREERREDRREDRDRERDRGERGDRERGGGHRGERGTEHYDGSREYRRDRDREEDRGTRKRRRSSSPSRRTDRSRYR